MFLALAETRKLQVLKFCIFQVSGLHRKQKNCHLKNHNCKQDLKFRQFDYFKLNDLSSFAPGIKKAYLDSWSIFSIVLCKAAEEVVVDVVLLRTYCC